MRQPWQQPRGIGAHQPHGRHATGSPTRHSTRAHTKGTTPYNPQATRSWHRPPAQAGLMGRCSTYSYDKHYPLCSHHAGIAQPLRTLRNLGSCASLRHPRAAYLLPMGMKMPYNLLLFICYRDMRAQPEHHCLHRLSTSGYFRRHAASTPLTLSIFGDYA